MRPSFDTRASQLTAPSPHTTVECTTATQHFFTHTHTRARLGAHSLRRSIDCERACAPLTRQALCTAHTVRTRMCERDDCDVGVLLTVACDRLPLDVRVEIGKRTFTCTQCALVGAFSAPRTLIASCVIYTQENFSRNKIDNYAQQMPRRRRRRSEMGSVGENTAAHANGVNDNDTKKAINITSKHQLQ